MWLKAAHWPGWSWLISAMRLTRQAPHNERERVWYYPYSDFKKNHFYILNRYIDTE
jgi:hypothetical protein